MSRPLLTHSGDLVRGEVVERPNRFVLHVDFGTGPERVFLGDPGALAVLSPGSTVLCDPVDDPDRTTDYDAIAVGHEGIYVSLRAALANDLVAAALEDDLLPPFQDETVIEREPQLPEHGRADFRLRKPDENERVVEVKSCTHVEDGIAKFPDRPTERGRRHLRSLHDLTASGTATAVVFVVQRPDAERFRPFREVDPEFADLLTQVIDAGTLVYVIAVAFEPPHYYLTATGLPVDH